MSRDNGQTLDEYRAETRTTLQAQSTLDGAVRVALGAASVCWENPSGSGVFDSERALIVAEELTAEARRRVALHGPARQQVLDLLTSMGYDPNHVVNVELDSQFVRVTSGHRIQNDEKRETTGG